MITEFSPPDLEEVWPDVSQQLLRCLLARGATRALAEDVVQDTAVRALETGVAFESADDLMRWARVVAYRLVIDAHRRRRFLADVEVPDVAGHESVDRQVEGRLALGAVADALKTMAVSQRQAIIDPQVAGIVDRREAVRLNVRRHRARTHLRAAVDGLLGILLGLGLRIRRWLDGLPDNVVQLTGVVVAASVLMLAAESPRPSEAHPLVVAAAPIVAIEGGARPLSPGPERLGRVDRSAVPITGSTAATASSPSPRTVADVPLPLPGARAYVREARPTDSHLACATVSAQPTCVDTPLMLPAPPVP